MRSKSFTSPELLALLTAQDQCSCKFLDMRAALFSNFPERFLRHAIVPKLEMRGVEVVSMASPQSAGTVDSEKVDVVLFMHEMASHNDDRIVRDASRALGVPMLCLSRKASAWEGKLPPVQPSVRRSTFEVQLPPAAVPAVAAEEPELSPNTGDQAMPENANSRKSVSDENLEPMLRRAMLLRGQGVKYGEMVSELRQFWIDPASLKTGDQLQSYLGNLHRRPECPEFYLQWIKAGRPTEAKPKKAKAVKPKKMRGMRGMPEKDLEKVLRLIMEQREKGKPYKDFLAAAQKCWPDGSGPSSADRLNKFAATAVHSPRVPSWYKAWFNRAKVHGAASAPKGDLGKKNDDAELAKVYSDENEALKARVAALEAGAKDVRVQLMATFASCQKLVEIGAIDAAGAFRIAMEFLGKI